MNGFEEGVLRVLQVEPDSAYARLVRTSLAGVSTAPIDVVWAPHVDDALERLRSESFTAALVDFPSGNGEEFNACLDLRAASPNLPIVVLSSRDDETLAFAALDAGAEDFLVKGRTDGVRVLRALRFAVARRCRGAASPGARRPADGQWRILVVEDNPGDAVLIAETLAPLTKGGGALSAVASLRDAVAQVRATPFDLAVLDLSLPDSRGVETSASLRLHAPQLPIIVYTGSADEGLALRTVQGGASDYLVKAQTDGRELYRAALFAVRRNSAAQMPLAPPVRRRVFAHDASAGADFRQHGGPVMAPAPSDRRDKPRYPLVRTALAIPLVADGRPDLENQLPGVTFDLSVDGIGLELETDRLLETTSLLVGVERRDGAFCYTGLEVRHMRLTAPRRLRLGGKLGGPADRILSHESLTPVFDLQTMRIVRGMPDHVLAAWGEIGVLRPVLLDWVQLCPQCRGLPTFRRGCRSCGSARTYAVRLVHHFACAYVGPTIEFETPEGLVCPKCRVRQLVVGSDFEYQSGPARCADCHWTSSDLEHIGQCLRCGFRFPGSQSLALELIGYHVHRLDPLAFISAP